MSRQQNAQANDRQRAARHRGEEATEIPATVPGTSRSSRCPQEDIADKETDKMSAARREQQSAAGVRMRTPMQTGTHAFAVKAYAERTARVGREGR